MKYLYALFLLLPFYANGQQKINFNQGTLLQKEFCDTIPFESIRDKMFVTVKIAGKARRFLFDTGATLVISKELQAEMQNNEIGAGTQIDGGGNKATVPFVWVDHLQLGTLTFLKTPAIVNNIKQTDFLSCFNFEGIIGSNLLRNCIVHIDLKRSHIILTNQIQNLKLENAIKSDIKLDAQSGPYVRLNLSNKIKVDALFDSGSDEFVSISKATFEKAQKKGLAKVLNEGFGTITYGLHGLESKQKKYRVEFNALRLGPAAIEHFIAVVSDKGENSFGLGLANYGSITIDYLNKKFYFVPHQTTQEFADTKTIGFILQPEEYYFSVGLVWENSQAEKAGLKTGFKILKINDLDIPERSYETDCALFLSRPLLSSVVKLTYLDEQQTIKTVALRQE
jgi:hypothetical protein